MVDQPRKGAVVDQTAKHNGATNQCHGVYLGDGVWMRRNRRERLGRQGKQRACELCTWAGVTKKKNY